MRDEQVDDIFIKYGYKPPKPWRKTKKLYDPNRDCFAYFPPLMENRSAECSALNRLYCRYEQCSFYKPFELKGLNDETGNEEED